MPGTLTSKRLRAADDAEAIDHVFRLGVVPFRLQGHDVAGQARHEP
jgi:hypothetical protein